MSSWDTNSWSSSCDPHTLGIYREIDNNKNFSTYSEVNVRIFLHTVKQDWSIWGWSEHVQDTQIWDKWCSFLNYCQFQPILGNELLMTFPETNRYCLGFFSCSDYIFYVGNKVCSRSDKKCIKNHKNMLKKSFRYTFFCWKLSNTVK